MGVDTAKPEREDGAGNGAMLDAVAELKTRGTLRSEALERAMRLTPRALFVPSQDSSSIYDLDHGTEIKRETKGDGTYEIISSATCLGFVCEMLECAELEPGLAVWEIGTGIGYSSALLSRVVGPSGYIHSAEIEPELADRARALLADLRCTNVDVAQGDGFSHSGSRTQYDRILVNAAVPELAPDWLDRLALGGIFVGVVQGPTSDFLLKGHKESYGLRIDVFKTFGGWNTFRSDHFSEGWFQSLLGSSLAPQESRMREIYKQPLRRIAPPASLSVDELLDMVAWHGQYPDLTAYFWLFAILSGFRGIPYDVEVVTDKDTRCSERLWLIVEEESLVQMWRRDKSTIMVFGDSAYEHLRAIIQKWLELNWRRQAPCLSGWVSHGRAKRSGFPQRHGWCRYGHHTSLVLSCT